MGGDGLDKGAGGRGAGRDPEMTQNGPRLHFYHLGSWAFEWKLSSVFKSTREFCFAHLISQAEIFVSVVLTDIGIHPYAWFSHENLEGVP